jgi:hypothetical protein
VPSSGSHPLACVASTNVRAPYDEHAATIASRSATRPSSDCTALTATSDVEASTAEGTSSSSTVSTSTPGAARNGQSTDVKSPCAQTTREPRGSDIATSPVNDDTWLPTATHDAGTPCIRAQIARDWPTAASQSCQLVRPWRHWSATAWSASNAGRGGSPYDAVLR